VFNRIDTMPSSCCGTNSVPISGTIRKLPMNVSPAMPAAA
jgi:hypothetical protein